MASPTESKVGENEVTSEPRHHHRNRDGRGGGDGDSQEIDSGYPPSRQSSIYSLTLDEIQNTVCEAGKSFGSMNMDEFLNNIWSAEGGFAAASSSNVSADSASAAVPANAPSGTASDGGSAASGGPPLYRQGSLTLPPPLCRKTVDEVWAEIHGEREVRHNVGGRAHRGRGNADRQPTFGEMTLEDFLIKAGVVQEGFGPASPHPSVTVAASMQQSYGLPTSYPVGTTVRHLPAGDNMAPPAKKRRTEAVEPPSAEEPETIEETPAKGGETDDLSKPDDTTATKSSTEKKDDAPAPDANPASKAKDRMARFKALQARAKTSAETNLKEATLESQRLATDPAQLTALHRKHAIASHKLLKADVEEAGEDFERKRAWDWTIDESEKWDKRLKKKAAHRDNNSFADQTQEANKIYKRQLRNINADMEKYEKDKQALIEKAAASGGLDIVETEDGELIAVDKDGSFYSTADSTTFSQNKPDKAAVDRLVADLQRAEEQRLKKRKERMAQNGDEGDVTYINEKNKQFNQKLSRFYNKYTAEIRDSFERGTMI